MPTLKPGTIRPSEEEEKEINAQAQADGTLHSAEELAQFTRLDSSALPAEFKAAVKRGRPRKAQPKLSVTLRYSAEVIEYFKSTGKGWQTRMDEVLREYVSSHR